MVVSRSLGNGNGNGNGNQTKQCKFLLGISSFEE